MRNDGVRNSRQPNGGALARVYLKPVNQAKARSGLPLDALVIIDFGGCTYRRLTPDHAERLGKELVAKAELARAELEAGHTPPEPPVANACALEAA